MRRLFALVAATVLVFLGAARVAEAVPITFEYRNVGDATAFGGGASDPFILRYTFDSGLPDASLGPDSGNYSQVTGSLRWGSIFVSFDPFSLGSILVDNRTSPGPDTYLVIFGGSGVVALGTQNIGQIFIFFGGPDLGFTSDALPLTPVFSTLATGAGAQITFEGEILQRGLKLAGLGSLHRVTVDEAGTLSLLLLGATALPLLRRRNTRARPQRLPA